MRVAVTADLVAAPHDLAHQLGVRPRRHPEDEEGRLDRQLVEQIEQRTGLTRERRAGLLPVRSADPAANELVPILEVDAQEQRLAQLSDRLDHLRREWHRKRLERSVVSSYQRKEVVRLSESTCGTLEVSGR